MSDFRITDLVERLKRGELTRRDFMKRAAVAGMSATAASSVLSGPALAAPGMSAATFARNQIDAKTLVIADSLSGGDWLTLDPAWFYEINSAIAMYVLYDQLYHIPDSTKPDDVQPLLAESMPEVSEDGLTITVKLRQGVKFHSTGNEMTSADVLFSWARLKATQYQGSFFAIDYWTEISAPDEYTVQFKLAAPNAAFAAVLTSLPLSVTDSAKVKELGGTDELPTYAEDATEDEIAADASIAKNKDAQKAIDSASVGTGPFMVSSYDLNSEVIFERNPDFWGEAPKFDRVIWRNILEPNAQLQAVETGEADIAYSLNPDSAPQVEENPDLQLITGPTLAIQYIGMNLKEERGGPTSKLEVRQAIAHGINYDAILQNILQGSAQRPALPIPLPLLGSEAALKDAYQYDLAKAQELWDASGVGEQEIEITYDSDSPGEGGVNLETLATAVKSDLEKINGLKIKLAPMPGTERITKYRAGDFQATISPWTPDYPDGDSYATPFFRTDTAAAKRVGYSDPEMDALLDQGLSERDPAKREAIYEEVHKKGLAVLPYIVLYQPIDRRPATKKVQGVTIHAVYILNIRNGSKTE
jgi:peptide/nickel transport system substrate-binding protein